MLPRDADQSRPATSNDLNRYRVSGRDRCSTSSWRGVGRWPGSKKFRFKNKLLSLDATVIDLCAELFDWAKFRRTKGAVKLHFMLDHDGYLPSVAGHHRRQAA